MLHISKEEPLLPTQNEIMERYNHIFWEVVNYRTQSNSPGQYTFDFRAPVTPIGKNLPNLTKKRSGIDQGSSISNRKYSQAPNQGKSGPFGPNTGRRHSQVSRNVQNRTIDGTRKEQFLTIQDESNWDNVIEYNV